MSGNIIIATSRIKACEMFYELCEYCGYDKTWVDALWGDIIRDDEIFAELAFYLNNHRMVLNAFRMMVDMKADPETYIKRLEEGRGEDRL